jgi:hypothetical protein
VTDRSDGWVDRTASPVNGWYRVIPFNLAGKAGSASRPVRAS